MSFRHLKNVLSIPDNSRTKVRCLEDVLRRLGTKHYISFRLNGEQFVKELEATCIYQLRTKGKNQKRVPFYFYAVCARALRKIDDVEQKQFANLKNVWI